MPKPKTANLKVVQMNLIMWLATIGLPMTHQIFGATCSCMRAATVEMDYQDNFPYGYPYQFARGPGAVPYAMSSSQIAPLVDLTANTCTFGPCISSSVGPGGAGRSSAGVGIAVNITPPGSVEVS